jgi:hypothetical protein
MGGDRTMEGGKERMAGDWYYTVSGGLRVGLVGRWRSRWRRGRRTGEGGGARYTFKHRRGVVEILVYDASPLSRWECCDTLRQRSSLTVMTSEDEGGPGK